MADPNDRIHLNTREARGGSTQRVMRYVLPISMGLIIVIFAVMILR